MEMAAKKEYIEVMRKRYTACKKKEEKSVVIEETRMVLKVHRKSVIRILNGKQRKKKKLCSHPYTRFNSTFKVDVGVINESRSHFPFPILSVDFDNGKEFVNWDLHGYCTRGGIAFTRSRSYHKNDQAHIEGKNYQSLRRAVGYGRITDQRLVDMFNDMYQIEHRLLTNFFYPTMKLYKSLQKKLIKLAKFQQSSSVTISNLATYHQTF